MLEIECVCKKFRKNKVLNDIDLSLDRYTYGFLGQNGSGKTTMLRCIMKYYRLDSGRIFFNDENGVESTDYLSHIGYLPQNFNTFENLTVRETLHFFASLKKHELSEEECRRMIDAVHLNNETDKQVRKLSGGMKRRLGIAAAMIGDNEILLLDEPTAGLDPDERRNFKNIISERKKNKCIVLSTHIVSDIESLCDRVLILNKGKITEFSSCQALAAVAEGKVYAVEHSAIPDWEYYKVEDIVLSNKHMVKIITNRRPNGIAMTPTTEDGYYCFRNLQK